MDTIRAFFFQKGKGDLPPSSYAPEDSKSIANTKYVCYKDFAKI